MKIVSEFSAIIFAKWDSFVFLKTNIEGLYVFVVLMASKKQVLMRSRVLHQYTNRYVTILNLTESSKVPKPFYWVLFCVGFEFPFKPFFNSDFPLHEWSYYARVGFINILK
jgi:hypothetical protein